MKRVLWSILALSLLFVACDFDFSNDDGGDGDVTVTKDTTIDGGVRRSYYLNEVKEANLKSYEDYFPGLDNPAQVQAYGKDGDFRHAYAYAYTDDGQVSIEAYYDKDKALSYYYVYVYNDAGLFDSQYTYDGNDRLTGASKVSYGSGASAEKEVLRASYDGDCELSALTHTSYDADGNWVKSFKYESVSADQVGKARVSRAKEGLTVPGYPDDLPELVLPDPDALPDSLKVSEYNYCYYDDYGDTALSLGADYYPTGFVRSQKNLDSDISVSLSHDDLGRITNKTTCYGSVSALVVDIEYEGNTFYPLTVATSGEAMVAPISYGFVWSETHAIEAINVYVSDNLFRTFTYEYDGEPIPVTLEQLKSIDPFAFMDGILDSVLTITESDPDGNTVESFVFSALDSGKGLKVTVKDAKGVSNGHYEINLDAQSGQAVSLGIYNKAGKLSSSYSYAYSDALDEVQEQLGRISEYYLSEENLDDIDSLVASFQKNFQYDLFF